MMKKRFLFLGMILGILVLSVSAFAEFGFLGKWGTIGTGDGEFNENWGVAADLDKVYVTDFKNHQLQVFSPEGVFLKKWGSFGAGRGEFNGPLGIATDSEGNVFVTEENGNRVQKFDPEGNFLLQFGTAGSGNGQFSRPAGIAIDYAGNIYVVDIGNNRIQKFDSEGTYLGKWGNYGTAEGQFSSPRFIAIDLKNRVLYVTDYENKRIQKFTLSGRWLETWDSARLGIPLERPYGISVNDAGDVYVTDRRLLIVYVFDSSGNLKGGWGGKYGTADCRFNEPAGITVNPYSNVYIADPLNQRVQQFGEGASPLLPRVCLFQGME